jgi:hypothetical protein
VTFGVFHGKLTDRGKMIISYHCAAKFKIHQTDNVLDKVTGYKEKELCFVQCVLQSIVENANRTVISLHHLH